MKNTFLPDLQIPIPVNSRRVWNPIKGAAIRGVSDLIPTYSITDSYPVIGSTTYGALDPSNQSSPNPFSSYIVSDIQPYEGEGGAFSRVSLAAVINATTALTTPVFSERLSVQDRYPGILESIKFLQ